MTNLWSGFCVAFSLYSAIPMPKTEWDKNTMKYALGFFPLVGVLVGALEYGWLLLSQFFKIEPILYAVIAVLIPMAVTGGIHWDGFTDTADALCSYGNQEKKLEILKDPHIGAFGVMHFVGLLLLQFGLYVQFYQAPSALLVLAFGFPFARTIGGLAIVSFPCAKNSGLAATFAKGSDKKAVRIVLVLEQLLIILLFMLVNPLAAIFAIIMDAVFLCVYRKFCLQIFGGITGDLAGFAITLCETTALVLCTAASFL